MVDLQQQQLKEIRTLIQEMGWEEFITSIAFMMAEQSYNMSPDSEQSKTLYACSNAILALKKVWAECGTYKYPNDMVTLR